LDNKLELLTYWIGGVTNRSRDDYVALALIVDDVLFTHKVFCDINPLFFPALLPEVLEFETWMKN
jgi:hypothetical protein